MERKGLHCIIHPYKIQDQIKLISCIKNQVCMLFWEVFLTEPWKHECAHFTRLHSCPLLIVFLRVWACTCSWLPSWWASQPRRFGTFLGLGVSGVHCSVSKSRRLSLPGAHCNPTLLSLLSWKASKEQKVLGPGSQKPNIASSPLFVLNALLTILFMITSLGFLKEL